MMLCYNNVQFENKAYCVNEEFDRGIWLADAKPALKDRNALANLPYIQDGEKYKMTPQSLPCTLYFLHTDVLW